MKPNEFFKLIGICILAKEKGLPEVINIYEKKLNGKTGPSLVKSLKY